MKAIGRNIIIKKLKEGVTETKGGLLLAESHRQDIRYVEATVVSTGSECDGISKNTEVDPFEPPEKCGRFPVVAEFDQLGGGDDL